MSNRYVRGALAAVAVTVGATVTALVPTAAQAHSLESSTISTHVSATGVDATISIALDTLDEALGGEPLASGDVEAWAERVTAYLDDHLTVTGADGAEWQETFGAVARESVEGIDSVSVDVAFDTGGSGTSVFEIAYDAVIDAVPGHEAVVVLTDAAGDVSTAGVLTSSTDALAVSTGADAGAAAASALDMVGHGFHHVLAGADHLLFLVVLLLTAPVVVVAGRWRRRTALAPTARDVLAVVTSFTVGHSLTLVGSALGWVHLPSRLVEVLVGASVGVAAVHAVRPLVRRGEALIAGVFGLVHGLAFAGILTDLGLEGSTTVLTLLAFNVGVELAQLAATAAVFPSLYLLARTRAYPAVRVAGAVVALAAAVGWVVDRLGLRANPLGALEDAAIAHPGAVVGGLALLALTAWLVDRRPPRSGLGRAALR
ncbi:HupE/UreJ family protein [Nocardioides sp. SYSU DS0663]|uniref:HupE/UreJ family protein n=1 Tax=Nocardioides sp. SYSU DS0663 TaxID=3416445 RepID=UPI003F4BC79A